MAEPTETAGDTTETAIASVLEQQEALGPVDAVFRWARARSLVALPFIGTVEQRSVAPWLTWARAAGLGMAPGSASPGQADLLVVIGHISHKLAPVLQRVHASMAHPAFALHVTCRAPGDPPEAYATVQRIREIIPVDVIIEGAPPGRASLDAGLEALGRRIRGRS